ncbi:MAG: beta-CASP ribonuclease aCPSF1 [Candidatus Aenigmarchaeota archaeon]|nr:beta-CASP ribonuclease aCPSF1 [Candidatus Aenigmarchaeota archaeon]
MTQIIDSIKEDLPKDAKISDISYEGSEIILYTKNKEFFKDSMDLIKRIVNKIKKRIEVRADPSIVADQEKTKDLIRQVVPQDAGIKDIYFEPEFAKVVIHAEKPGLVIGKAGETLMTIKEKTFWTPSIQRAPVIDSDVIRSIRKMLHKEAGYRKKFLNTLGEKIYAPGKDVEWIRITALGAFREVGRSCILLQTPQSKVLLDCGMSIAATASKPFPYLDVPEFQLDKLDAIVLSHAHTDHSGLVPYLYEYGYKGPLYCTRPTRDISAMLQLDYIQICQRENKKPFYSSKGIEEAVKHCIPLDYDEVSDITPDMRLTLANAGHILGSSVVHIHIGDGLYNVLYTGDIKFERTKMFERASTDFTRAETVIIESTYGGNDDVLPPRKDAEKSLIEHVKVAIDRGGKVLIPCFAVGRGQDILAILADSNIDVPIFMDGMIWDATAIHTAYPEFLSQNMQKQILHKSNNPFIDPRLKGIGSQKEREMTFNHVGPCVILSTSGMLIGGPAIEHLKKICTDPKNMLLFVGYQGEGTPGRRIQKGWKQIQLDSGDMLDLKLEIQTVKGLGGHSDQPQLLNYLRHLNNRPRKIIIDHGESTKCVEFAKTIHREFRIETIAPKNLETIRLR